MGHWLVLCRPLFSKAGLRVEILKYLTLSSNPSTHNPELCQNVEFDRYFIEKSF